MKRSLLLYALLSLATAASAAERTLQIQLDAAELEKGTKYEFEVRAYYVIFERQAGSIDIDDTLLEDSIAAPEVYRGSFTAPLTPKTTPAPVTFRFPTAAPPPPGMIGTVVFKLDITITPPATSGRQPMKRSRTYGGPPITSDAPIAPHCLRLRGPIASGSFYLGVSDCTEGIMAPPKKR